MEPTAAERAIARRSAEARATVPHLELQAEVDMGAALALRERERCSITSMLVRACALALRDVPRANGTYRDGRFELYSRVNIGVAVSSEEACLIPTVFDADRKSIGELTAEIEELRRLSLRDQLPAPAFSGATFTLSNAGRHGAQRTAMITAAGQAAAISAGTIREVPVVRDRSVVPGLVMALTLTCDHRILYGARAVRFLDVVKSALASGSPETAP